MSDKTLRYAAILPLVYAPIAGGPVLEAFEVRADAAAAFAPHRPYALLLKEPAREDEGHENDQSAEDAQPVYAAATSSEQSTTQVSFLQNEDPPPTYRGRPQINDQDWVPSSLMTPKV